MSEHNGSNPRDVIYYWVWDNSFWTQPNTKIHIFSDRDAQVEIKWVTRVEVIDYSNWGRCYVNMNVKSFDVSAQDDWKTIKLFVE